MHLHPRPFAMIANGTKTIEIRINDEKRQLLKIGDLIEFTSRIDQENKVTVTVTALPIFKTFEELFYAFPPAEYGGESQDEYDKMYDHYSKDEEQKYGVVAIQFKLR